jgi:hypothetical protein
VCFSHDALGTFGQMTGRIELDGRLRGLAGLGKVAQAEE